MSPAQIPCEEHPDGDPDETAPHALTEAEHLTESSPDDPVPGTENVDEVGKGAEPGETFAEATPPTTPRDPTPPGSPLRRTYIDYGNP